MKRSATEQDWTVTVARLGYVDTSSVGHGVLRATDVRAGGRVVIKIASSSRSPEALRRERAFLEAAQGAVAGVASAKCVLWTGEEASPCLLVTRDVGDETLAEALQRSVSHARALLASVAQLAEAVAVLHDAGIVHGDLAPENVLLRADDPPVLVDFSSASWAEEAVPQDSPGTVGFSCPVRFAAGARAACAQDVWSLAALCYSACVGVAPLGASSPRGAWALATAAAPPLPLQSLAPSVPRELSDLVHHVLIANGASDRTPEAAAFAEALRRCLRDVTSAPLDALRPFAVRVDAARVAGLTDTAPLPVVSGEPPEVGRTTLRNRLTSALEAIVKPENDAPLDRADDGGEPGAPSGASNPAVSRGTKPTRDLVAAIGRVGREGVQNRHPRVVFGIALALLCGLFIVPFLRGSADESVVNSDAATPRADGGPEVTEETPDDVEEDPLGPAPESVPFHPDEAFAHAGYAPTRHGTLEGSGAVALHELVWRAEVDEAVKSTLVVASGRLFFGANDGRVYALDAATGRREWSFDSGSDVSGGLVVDGGRVLAGNDDGRFFSLDGTTGELQWAADVEGKVWSSPVVVDGRVIVATNRGSIVALDIDDGALLWSLEVEGEARAPLSSDGDSVFGATVRGLLCSNTCRYARDGDCDDGGGRSSYELCRFGTDCADCGARRRPSRSVREVFSATGTVFRIDVPTGQLLWEVEIDDGATAAPVPDGDTVLVADWGGSVRRMRKIDGAELVVQTVDGAEFAGSGALADRWILPSTDGVVRALNPQTFAPVWERALAEGVTASVSATRDTVLVPGEEGTVHVLDVENGSPLWTFKTQAEVSTAPVTWESLTIFANNDGALFAVR